MTPENGVGSGREPPLTDSALGRAPTDPQSLGDRSPDAGLTVSELDGARPVADLWRAKMRASLSSKLFGVSADPVRLGRFIILERLGRGGMGEVYSAYDPKLDRRVALKLLRLDTTAAHEGARARLEREAMALAQLSHPNVVPVHDVGAIETDDPFDGPPGQQVFIVMELVTGQNLRHWAEDEPRSWRQILDAYRQAGAGLAAAHAVGLVHRDFKPANVQVGEDGRVRVLDFGLARTASGPAVGGDASAAPAEDAPMTASPETDTEGRVQERAVVPVAAQALQNAETALPAPSKRRRRKPRPSRTADTRDHLYSPLTETGAVLGTPAFMSPEQFAGVEVGPASDQFSFAVALYEALYRSRPFDGPTLAELADNVMEGRLLSPARARDVPGWLYPILERALSARPADRYPSMDAMLDDLARDPERARRRRFQRLSMVALVVAVIGLSAYQLTRSRVEVDPCTRSADRLVGVWDIPRRAQLQETFSAIDHPYAERAWLRVAGSLETYAGRFTAMHENACRAHQRGEQSGILLDRRMACLERRRVALASAVAVLGDTDGSALDDAITVTRELPDIDYCADERAMLAAVAPPEAPDVARQVDELRSRASHAQALAHMGRYRDAVTAMTPLITDAETLAYDPLVAEMHLLRGRLGTHLRERGIAIPALQRAADMGFATGIYEVGLEALARLIYFEGLAGERELALARLSLFEALAGQISERSFVRALLFNNVGAVHRAGGDMDRARQYFERALAARPASGGPIELAGIRYNLALVTADPLRRHERLLGSLEEFERTLGPGHPLTLKQRVISAPHVLSPPAAHALLSPGCALYGQLHAKLGRERGKCLRLLAELEVELGRPEDAARHYAEAAPLLAAGDPFADMARALAALHSGAPRRAVAISRALVARIDSPRAPEAAPRSWWEEEPVAMAWSILGESHARLRDREAALDALERAHAGFVRVTEQTLSVASWRNLARTRSALARGLCPATTEARTPPAGGSAEDVSAAPGVEVAVSAACARAERLRQQALAWYRQAGDGYERHRSALADSQVRSPGSP